MIKVCPDKECRFGSFCDKYCRKCGSVLQEPEPTPPTNFPCPNCKASVFPWDKYCGTCGQNLSFYVYIFLFQREGNEFPCTMIFAVSLSKAFDALSKETGKGLDYLQEKYKLVEIFALGNVKIKGVSDDN